MSKSAYDAIVVGSGPNGLAAAITLQQTGLSVLVLEGKDTIGGGLRSAALTLPGFVHDICSAVHPLAVGSPFFQSLPLAEHGLRFVSPPLSAAHPFDGGTAAALGSLEQTAQSLGVDERAYLDLLTPVVQNWPTMAADILGPLRWPKHPLNMARFGLDALPPVTQLAKRFATKEAKGLLAGMAAHSIQPLTNLTTSAIALVLMTAGHLRGWPVPVGGSQTIANALASYFRSIGGVIETNTPVQSLTQLPPAQAVLLDVTPSQLLQMAGERFSNSPASRAYRWQLEHYRYGMGVFKIDWALDGPIPFTAPECRQTGTIHLGGTLDEITAGEQATSAGGHPNKPFVLLAQQSLFDTSRVPDPAVGANHQTAWAYCHVPNGSTVDRTEVIEQQVERFAPGFRDRILARHTMNTVQMETYNPNYIGGDINGGIIDIRQLYTRPVISLSPYKTAAKGLYICSSSTPPGGGVHGMCGYHAARTALHDVFGLEPAIPLSNG